MLAPDPRAVAHSLQEALAKAGVRTDVHDGYRLALVSVWTGLVVWCDGYQFWWEARWDETRHRAVYARHPASEPQRAARRVRFRLDQLRGNEGSMWAGYGMAQIPRPRESP